MFDFEAALNPQERSVTVEKELGSIVLKLAGFDTNMAFDTNRWQSLVVSQRLVDADEFMFQIGLNRIVGWEGVKNKQGEDVPFGPDMLNAWSRIPKAIPYIMEAGKLTLEESGVVKSVEKKVGSVLAEPPSEPSEPSESNTTTG